MTATKSETTVMTAIHEARGATGLEVLRLTPSPAAAATRTNPALLGRTESAAGTISVVTARVLARSLPKKTGVMSKTSRALAGRIGVAEIKIETSIATGHETAIAKIRIRKIGAMSATMMTRSIDLATKTRRGTVVATLNPTRMSAITSRRNTTPLVEAAKTASEIVTATTRRSHPLVPSPRPRMRPPVLRQITSPSAEQAGPRLRSTWLLHSLRPVPARSCRLKVRQQIGIVTATATADPAGKVA
jgi:hypothetical protein